MCKKRFHKIITMFDQGSDKKKTHGCTHTKTHTHRCIHTHTGISQKIIRYFQVLCHKIGQTEKQVLHTEILLLSQGDVRNCHSKFHDKISAFLIDLKINL